MIIGIGVDVCSISRIERAMRSEHFTRRIFTDDEIKYAARKARPAASFAVAFAAREAFCKASGIPMYEVVFGRGVSLLRNENGRPSLKISDDVKAKLPQDAVHFLSVSHEGDIAVAYVVSERI